MYDKFLIPLDGSRLAEAILPHVSELAKRLDAQIELLAVIDPDAPAFRGGSTQEAGGRLSRDALVEQANNQAKDYLNGIRNSLNAQAEAVVLEGNPALVIVDEQDRAGADLIAMSTHGRTGLMRGILGSVTDKVLRTAGVPMLIFSPGEDDDESSGSNVTPEMRIDTIIVPLDGSEISESVLPHATELVERLSLDIILVNAVRVRMEDAYYGTGYSVDPTPIEEQLVRESEEYLVRLCEGLQERNLDVKWKVILDLPAQGIVNLAKETPNSIIAISTRGQSGLTRFVLGSVTERVVRESRMPVLVIPPTEES